MVRFTVAVRVRMLPTAVTVIGYVPGIVDDPTLNVNMDDPDPGAGIGLVPKLAVVPAGTPDTDSEMGAENPLPAVVLTVTLPALPCATLSVDVDTVNVNFGAVTTVSVSVMVFVMPPPVAVTVIGYVASLVACVTSNVTMELPEPGAGTGLTLKPTVAPDGTPAAESVIRN